MKKEVYITPERHTGINQIMMNEISKIALLNSILNSFLQNPTMKVVLDGQYHQAKCQNPFSCLFFKDIPDESLSIIGEICRPHIHVLATC